jgi:hypothetical protein
VGSGLRPWAARSSPTARVSRRLTESCRLWPFKAPSDVWTVGQLVSHASMGETLDSGELFGPGTIGGGCGFEVGRWIQPGDVVELEIEGIGVLRTRVVKAG